VVDRRLIDFKSEDTAAGVRVLALFPRGSSATAGLMVGDVITQFDKQKVNKVEQIAEALRAAKPKTKVVYKVTRGSETKDLVITVPEPLTTTRRRPTRPYAQWYGGQRENSQNDQGPDGFEYGGVYRSSDGGESWVRINSVNPRPMYFSQIRVDPGDDRFVYVLGVRLYRSDNAGKTFQQTALGAVHDDQHAMWIDPRDGRHMLLGTDGGSYVSYDRCARWDYLNTMAIGQFYHCAVDNRRPYRVYGGLQDNGSWGGPSLTLDGRGPINADWVQVQGGDGYVCRVDPVDPDIVYSEMQDGGMMRSNLKTGESASIRPRAPAGQPPYRFNWNTPMILSHHNPRIFYCAGNFVFRSVKRGDDLRIISPDLTSSSRASATALGESPRNPDVLWVGTDDGNLWVTRDGGAKWSNIASRVGLPKPMYVATVEPSRSVEGRCYVCFDGHRSDIDDPFIYVTEDFGQTWKPIRGNLPSGSSRCLREDLFNQDVLYLGTEFCVHASIDRGSTWTKINNNLPTVAVHELAQHPTAGEMVAATHGRSLWVLDVTPLRQLKPAMTKAPATLLAPNTVTRWRRQARRGTMYGPGNRGFAGENPQPGAHLYYALTKKVGKLQLTVQDFSGKTIATVAVKNEPGLHRVTWNLRGSAPTRVGVDTLVASPQTVQRGRGQRGGGGGGGAPGGGGRGGGGRFGAGGGGVAAPPGAYRIVLNVDGTDLVQGLRLENDPTLPPRTIITEDQPALPRRQQDFDR
jgi:photosystem II stability/assembly factor-like uncharacterized protein